MSTYLITGSSRGIGLALAALIASKPDVRKVFASARSETGEVRKLVDESGGKVEFVELDVTSAESLRGAVAVVEGRVGEGGLDVLVNNAGVMPFTPTGVENMEGLDEVFRINVLSVHATIAAFLPVLRKGAGRKVVNVSTTLGSITMAPSYAYNPAPAYKITKAALNMLTVQYALDLQKEDFTVVAVSPGWIQTDLGGPHADLTVEQGVNAVWDIVARIGKEDSGKFFNVKVEGWEKTDGPNQYDGLEVPW